VCELSEAAAEPGQQSRIATNTSMLLILSSIFNRFVAALPIRLVRDEHQTQQPQRRGSWGSAPPLAVGFDVLSTTETCFKVAPFTVVPPQNIVSQLLLTRWRTTTLVDKTIRTATTVQEQYSTSYPWLVL